MEVEWPPMALIVFIRSSGLGQELRTPKLSELYTVH